MRGRIALLAAGAAAAVAVAHKLRRRRPVLPQVTVPEPEPGPDPRAEELREKLAASREVVDERDADEERETPVDEAVALDDGDVEARRRELHKRGRATVAEMRSDSETS